MHGEGSGFPRGIAAHVALQTLRAFLAGGGGDFIDLVVLVTPVRCWRARPVQARMGGHLLLSVGSGASAARRSATSGDSAENYILRRAGCGRDGR